MKLITFKYTDAKGKETNRQVLVTQEPSTMIGGFDVGDITEQQMAEFAGFYMAAQTEFMQKVQALKNEYDLNHSYRNFIPERMQDVVREELT